MKKTVLSVCPGARRWAFENVKMFSYCGYKVTILDTVKYEYDCDYNFNNYDVDIYKIKAANRFQSGWKKYIYRSLKFIEKLDHIICKPSFIKRFGRTPEELDWGWVDNLLLARYLAKEIDEFKADIVLGEPSYLQGLAVALSGSKIKIVAPWGADATESMYASLGQYFVLKYVYKKCDKILMSSRTACETLGKIYNIPNEKFLHLIKGTLEFESLPNKAEARKSICTEYHIPEHFKIIHSARRFQIRYNTMYGFKACVELLKEDKEVFCFFTIGGTRSDLAKQAISEMDKLPDDIRERLVFLEGEVSYDKFMNILAGADVFLSLRGAGDMRAATVLEGTYVGTVPVLADYKEWNYYVEEGAKAILVDPCNVVDIKKGIKRAFEVQQEFAEYNPKYMLDNYGTDALLEKFNDAIASIS
jgi:glycosyltransferase involved in cell wall biosynthesis